MKQSADQRVGVSFVAENEDEAEYGALVSRLQHGGIAEAAGLLKGDRVLSINNLSVTSAASAAATIRSSLGDVDVVVERDDIHEKQRLLKVWRLQPPKNVERALKRHRCHSTRPL